MIETAFHAPAISALTLLAVAALLLSLLSDRLGLGRSSGALLAGLLLGPAVLGSMAPEIHRPWFLGGLEEHAALQHLNDEYEKGLETLKHIDVTEIALDEHRQFWRPRLEQAQLVLRVAESRHQNTMRTGLFLLVIPLCLGLCGFAGLQKTSPEDIGHALPVMLTAMLASGAAAAGAICLMRWMGRLELPEGPTMWMIVIATAAMVPAAFGTAQNHEAGSVTTLGLPMALGAWLGLQAVTSDSPSSAWSLWIGAAGLIAAPWWLTATRSVLRSTPRPLLAISAIALIGLGARSGITLWAAAWAVGALLGTTTDRPFGEHLRRYLLEPLILGFAALIAQPTLDFDWMLLILLLIAFTDARAGGALIAARLHHGMAWMSGLKLGTLLAQGGPLSVALALGGYAAGWIPGPIYAALILCVLIADVFCTPMLKLIERMDQSGGASASDAGGASLS